MTCSTNAHRTRPGSAHRCPGRRGPASPATSRRRPRSGTRPPGRSRSRDGRRGTPRAAHSSWHRTLPGTGDKFRRCCWLAAPLRVGKNGVSRALDVSSSNGTPAPRTGEYEMTQPGDTEVDTDSAPATTVDTSAVPAGRPVVFIHGLWLHATSWDPWMDLFRQAGYAPTAPGWPGDSDTVEETRRDPSKVAGQGIDDVVDHYAQVIEGLGAKPIVIGHSFGGLMVQRLLGQDLATAGVAIDPAPIKGVLNLPLSALRVASIALRNPANRNKAIALTPEQFRYGFANALPAQESAELYERWTVPSPGKPLFEAASA